MDISTHDEVPKEEVKGYSNWLLDEVNKILENHIKEVEPFVECYLLWYGTAGRCWSCFARELCLRISENDC